MGFIWILDFHFKIVHVLRRRYLIPIRCNNGKRKMWPWRWLHHFDFQHWRWLHSLMPMVAWFRAGNFWHTHSRSPAYTYAMIVVKCDTCKISGAYAHLDCITSNITGDPLHSRAACTQPCSVNTHSRAHCSPGARLCGQWGHGCVNNGARLCASARLCRGSPVNMGDIGNRQSMQVTHSYKERIFHLFPPQLKTNLWMIWHHKLKLPLSAKYS